jgi:hypothetical protein
MADIQWWDDVQGRVRLYENSEAMKRARDAELLTIEHERRMLIAQQIEAESRWMAIEDNTVGYDVLSYTKGEFGPLNKLIEVKSTIASPVRFYLSRNEWEHAIEYGESYFFHVWNLQLTPPVLYEKTVAQIAPHIPLDNAKGKWKTVQIPVGA